MTTSLHTGVSGLMAHQKMLDVVGNNLANLNTIGFKGGRVVFSDLLNTTIQYPRDGKDNHSGGTNPLQIGSGVRLAQAAKTFRQGNLEQTGEMFDFAIQGDGFFVVNDGNINRFTRAGAFSVDSNGTLVDPATGYRVQRFGTLGEPTPAAHGFQVPGDRSIRVPFGERIPGEPTRQLELNGNLNGQGLPGQVAILNSDAPLQVGGVSAALHHLLNELDSNVVPYTSGDAIELLGTDVDGAAVQTTVAVDDTTTLADLLDTIQSSFHGTNASLLPDGTLELRAELPGNSPISLQLSDVAGNTGTSDLSTHAMAIVQPGSDGSTTGSSLEVFDARGGAHAIHLEFSKAGLNTWDLNATLQPDSGVVLNGSVTGIQFHEDGTFGQIEGSGQGEAELTFQFDGFSEPQTVSINLEPLTQFAADSAITIHQDGLASGSLSSANVNAEGVLMGVATNGREIPLAQVALANFANPQGLIAMSDNYYRESLNTGSPQYGGANSGGRGGIRAGQLEQSNVDLAFEFTRLIVAQKGFSANARTISTSDRVLEELVNLIR